MKYEFDSIGEIHSPCTQIFAVPRQSYFAPKLSAQIEIFPPYHQRDCFLELDQFSHIWVMSVFHRNYHNKKPKWNATVRPPRLGGKKRVGVFASRSPYRPNPIALSVYKLESICYESNKCVLNILGCDLVDGTPILDIKPYLHYADAIENANSGYTDVLSDACLEVAFSEQAELQCMELSNEYPELQNLIIEILQQDPRPAHQVGHVQKVYGFSLYDVNIRFTVNDNVILISSLVKITDDKTSSMSEF